jgi:serine/threonine protein kinase
MAGLELSTDLRTPLLTAANLDTLTPADANPQIRGSVQVALEAARIGRELGPRYTVGGLLGRGGFASVWEVVDGVVAERLAAKRFEAAAVRGTEFYREMSALFRLDHPNIVRIVNLLDVSEVTRYLFLEYCPGGTLRELFRKSRRDGRSVPLDFLSRMAIELCRGLSYAHRLGLVHRDLKPENILFAGPVSDDDPGVTKLADFGLVRALRTGEAAGLSRLSGTPAYIAPEQISGQFSTGTDLYALGVVLYEALHGRTPFEGSPEQIALQHLNRPPEINPSLPSRWIEVLSALLEKDPERRPSDASWVIDRLDLAARPAIESPTTNPSIARCLGVEARAIVADGSSGVLVLTAFGLFRFKESTATRSGIIHRSATLARGSSGGAVWLASGCQVLQLTEGEADARVVLQLAEPIDDLALSPANPASIAVRTGSTVWEYDAAELPPRLRWRREISGVIPDSLARLSDGRVVVATEGETSLLHVFDATGKTTEVIRLPGSLENLMPLGSALVSKIRVNGATLAYRIDVETSTVVPLEGPGEVVALAVDPTNQQQVIGLFLSGEIVRWKSTGEPQNLGRFRKEEGPFLGLAVSGDLLWALSARNDSTWLIVRPIPRLD